ncbi:SDR family NAD(P)-dependent oxidoreductase [Williamsia sterculiae]|uniref:Short-chain dehydrogenase n=1 Tax=Williamsia sterculiae TaxID=1344003 RepID=A0A1N7CCY7_9NOCA|nr:SDR family NAD(P)-dependent oxidoreductase [Williamsia sterculiae]SIR61456.1 Short-chain dehydrogenase [Williamsia sterculiae]
MTTAEHDNPFTWIVTGATRGFGRSIVETALGRGDAVVAAVRRPAAMDDLAEQFADLLAVVEFDALHIDGVPAVVDAALDRFGRIDALINNAGRGYVGAAEEIPDAQLRESLALHLFTPAELVRAVLPHMRARRSGTIVQMSSQGGRLSFGGVGTYSAGKFALEGWSEALAWEIASFGVRVMIVEPSRFRTAFNESDVLSVAESSEIYADVLAAVRADMLGADGVQEGDPDRAAAIIVDLVHGDHVPLRLPLGAEAVQRLGFAYSGAAADLDRWADTARDADFPGVAASVRPV